MKLYGFAVRDVKAEVFTKPAFYRSPGEAVRTVMDECRNPESLLCKHPEDFELFLVCEYDLETGAVTPVQLRSYGGGLELTRSEANG